MPNKTVKQRNSEPASQTLDRGLRLLEAIADAPEPVTTGQVAAMVGLHRSVAYRLLRTLEDHRLVRREPGDRFAPGYRLATLARRAVNGSSLRSASGVGIDRNARMRRSDVDGCACRSGVVVT